MSKISFVKLVFHKTLTSKSINPSILQSLYSFLDGLVQKYLHLQATIRVRQLAYVAWVDTYAHFFPINFSSFRNFSDSYEFTLFYLFVFGRDRSFTVRICFKETLFFNFSCKLFNK